MDFNDSPEVSAPVDHPQRRLANPYIDEVDDSCPPEIKNFELETDPYRNFLPGISSVNAAKTVGGGLKAGKGGNRLLLAVSLLLVAVLILPAFAAAIAQLLH